MASLTIPSLSTVNPISGQWFIPTVTSSAYTFTTKTEINTITFEKLPIDISNILNNYIYDIHDDIFIFNIEQHKKKTQPLETIMELMNNNTIFELSINRNDYIISIKNVKFLKFVNLFDEESLNILKVKFKYNEIIYNNKLLSVSERRFLKLRKLMKNIKN
jgi:hypothetical protein